MCLQVFALDLHIRLKAFMLRALVLFASRWIFLVLTVMVANAHIPHEVSNGQLLEALKWNAFPTPM